nr:LysR family transcriptional regulator [Rhodobacter xinxiangensis]
MRDAAIRDLKAVLAVARRRSFRAAAADLDMSTTALSHSIARLEAGLGVRLFHRTTRSVSLTGAGDSFVAQIAPAVADIDDAMEVVRAQRDTPAGMLRINASRVAGCEVIGPLVLEFLRRYPEMQVDLVTEERLVDIVAEGFDLGIRPAHLVPSDMIALSLGRPQRYAVVASPDYLRAHPMPRVPADLLAHECIRVRLPNGTPFRWQFERAGEVLHLDVRGRLVLDEADVARLAVLAGGMIGFFVEGSVLADIAAGRLIRVLEDWTPPRPGFSLYYAGRRNPSAGMAAFVALAREVARG